MNKVLIVVLTVGLFATSCASTKTTSNRTATKARMAEITTNYGTIVIKLYDSTPLHRDNFVKLVKEGFYDSLLFHRVIDSFMIQGGDPESKKAPDSAQLGAGEAPGDRIPAEFNKNYFHKKGALAAARDDNPQKASSNCQFYIVQGKPYSDTVLNMLECQIRNDNPAFYFTDQQRNVYKTLGGTPFLDQNYTVFGEVVKGLEIVDKIATLPRDANDRPVQNVRMHIRMLN